MKYLIDNAHFIIIHVPIAMLIFSFVFDVMALLFKKREWHSAGLLCLVVGTLGAIGAVLTGPEGERNPLYPRHELFGKITMVFFIVLTLFRLLLLWKKKYNAGRSIVYLSAALVGVLLVSYTGHLGGEMVHPDRHNFRNFDRFRQGGGNGQFSQRYQNNNHGQNGPNGQNSRPSSSSGQTSPATNNNG